MTACAVRNTVFACDPTGLKEPVLAVIPRPDICLAPQRARPPQRLAEQHHGPRRQTYQFGSSLSTGIPPLEQVSRTSSGSSVDTYTNGR